MSYAPLCRGLSSLVTADVVSDREPGWNMGEFIHPLKMPVGYTIRYCMRCSFVSKKAYVDRFYLLIYKFL